MALSEQGAICTISFHGTQRRGDFHPGLQTMNQHREFFVMKLRTLTVAAALACAIGPAFAASSASASLSNITFTLYDLNPTDGTNPMLTFTGGVGVYGSYVSAAASESDLLTGGDSASQTKTGAQFTTSRSASVATDSSSAQSAVVGSGLTSIGGTTPTSVFLSNVSANGQAAFPAGAGTADFSASAMSPQSNWYTNFTLSNNTLLLVTMNASTSAGITIGYDSVNGINEYANANASVSLSGTGASGSGSQSAYDNSSSSVNGWWSYGPASSADARMMAVSFSNVSGHDLTGNFSLNTSVSGFSQSAVPVPEPETYAMMLAGLGALGFISRRRRQN
jgi:hypothetical protein